MLKAIAIALEAIENYAACLFALPPNPPCFGSVYVRRITAHTVICAVWVHVILGALLLPFCSRIGTLEMSVPERTVMWLFVLLWIFVSPYRMKLFMRVSGLTPFTPPDARTCGLSPKGAEAIQTIQNKYVVCVRDMSHLDSFKTDPSVPVSENSRD